MHVLQLLLHSNISLIATHTCTEQMPLALHLPLFLAVQSSREYQTILEVLLVLADPKIKQTMLKHYVFMHAKIPRLIKTQVCVWKLHVHVPQLASILYDQQFTAVQTFMHTSLHIMIHIYMYLTCLHTLAFQVAQVVHPIQEVQHPLQDPRYVNIAI